MTKKSGLIWAMAALALVLLSIALPAAPAGALSNSTTSVTDNSALITGGGTLIFTATVTGDGGGTPGGTVAWSGSTCTTSTTTLDTSGDATCTISDAQASTSYSVTAAFTDTD